MVLYLLTLRQEENQGLTMSETFFTSDSHFSHAGIIQFSETKPFRHFETIEEHDEELVSRWNSVVGKKDNVWHLGDFCFGRRNIAIAERLNGYKKLIMGNHDMYGADEYLKYFAKVYGMYEYKGMILTHAPLHPCQLKRWYLNIHGHLHTRVVILESDLLRDIKASDGTTIQTYLDAGNVDPRYINVSAEQTNLTPVPLDWIYNKWAERN